MNDKKRMKKEEKKGGKKGRGLRSLTLFEHFSENLSTEAH